VTRLTKPRMADFGAPSIQEGSGSLSTIDASGFWPRDGTSMLYQRSAGLTGMRAGLVWRLRAKSMRYQRPDNRPMSQSFGPLVLFPSIGAGLRSNSQNLCDKGRC